MKTQVPAIQADNAIAKFDITPEAVAEMVKDVFEMKVLPRDTKSYKVARTKLTQLVHTRTSVDKRRKALGVEAREYVNNVNKAGALLSEPLAPAEEHLRSELKAEDDRKEAIFAEKARIEQERVNEIRAKIAAMQNNVIVARGLTAKGIRSLIAQVEEIDITEEVYQEFYQEALETGSAALVELSKTLQTQDAVEFADEERRMETTRLEALKKEREAEEAKLKAAQDKLDAEKAEQKRIQKEAEDRLAEERQKVQAEKDEIEAEKKAEQDRKDREEFERQAKEEAKIQADKDAKEAAERVEAERIAQERAEAEEKARQEALRPDKEKLLAWLGLFNNDNLPKPDLKSEEAKTVLNNALRSLGVWLKDTKKKVESL